MSKHEAALCRLSEIGDGEMKEFNVDGTPVLLARVNGKCSAVGARCTHYGAPLVDGALVGDKIICPWHHACFSSTTGDMIEPPALDSLTNYPLRIDGENIYVELSDDAGDRRMPRMAKRESSKDKRTFVILGGGAAGYMAAQTLREDGFGGQVLMITREGRAPYDRPNLSKDYLFGEADPEWMPLRRDDFFTEHGIEIIYEREAAGVDVAGKTITLNNGDDISFDRLLVATGGLPRTLNVPGSSLMNILALRSFDSADCIIAAAKGATEVAIVGASFIGMEAAASLRKRGLNVTIIAPDTVPFEKTLGPEIGALFQRIHESNGVTFRLSNHVTQFEGSENVSGVVLDSGVRLDADLVIVGVGVIPGTDFLSNISLGPDGAVITDSHLRIDTNVYAAGDIVRFPDVRGGESVRIEHGRTALQQGRAAAHNMAGIETVYDSVPFFWTTQFDATLNYVGHAATWDEIIIKGDLNRRDFLAFYVKGERILAAAGMNRDRELAYLEGLFAIDKLPSIDVIREIGADIFELTKAFAAA